MSRYLRSPIFSTLVLALLVIAAVLALAPRQAAAQAADPAVAPIQSFYDTLTAAMKSGGTAKSRYEKLKPAVEKTFDLPAMTAVAVGPSWSTIPAAEQKALIDAFTRMTIANYAKNFDSFDGQKFTVDPTPIARGAERLVKSNLVSGGESIAFNYRVHDAGGAWKVVDVFLAGNISQMAQKRSDFGATLRSAGPQGLTKKINDLSDQMLG
jgi:phospholipid transport system substrate-binding protein